MFHRLANLLFPPRCPMCGGPVEDLTLLCPDCAASALWITGPAALYRGRAFACCVCAGWYRGELKQSVRRFKFSGKRGYARAYGPVLARTVQAHLEGRYDCVTWVPVSRQTLKKRGYDQARLLAEACAAALGTRAVPLLEKTGSNAAQSSLTEGRQRWENVKGVYIVPEPEQVRGRRVLLIDDILTTGATLEEAAGTLRRAGAAQVFGATLCRTPKRKGEEP